MIKIKLPLFGYLPTGQVPVDDSELSKRAIKLAT